MQTDYETEMIKMTVDQWADVPDNPRQRNTEFHAQKSKHLDRLEATHTLVSMAKLPNGDCYKLDGHTRALKWAENPELRPKGKLNVMVVFVPTIAEVRRLYTHFDAKEALESTSDSIYGAMRQNKVSRESSFLQRSKISTPLHCANFYMGLTNKRYEQNPDWNKLVAPFKNELTLLDKLMNTKVSESKMISGKNLSAPAVAIFLMAQKKHKDNRRKQELIMEFYKLFLQNLGKKDGIKKDYVQTFYDNMLNYKQMGQNSHQSRSLASFDDAVENGLRCVEQWMVTPDKMVQFVLKISIADYWDFVPSDERKT